MIRFTTGIMRPEEQPDAWPQPDEPTLVAPAPPPPPSDPYAAPPPPDRRIGSGMLLALGVLALIVAGLVAAWFLTHRGTGRASRTVTTAAITVRTPVAEVSIPDVHGLSLTAAQARLGLLGLKTAVAPVTSSGRIGTIVREVPAAGSKLPKGSVVTLSEVRAHPTPTPTVSTRPKPKPKPHTTTAPATSTVVVTTSPTTTAAQATTPTTTAAAPPQPQNATMPGVTGRTEAGAVQAMWNAGVFPSLAFVPATDPLGTVEQQAKPAGSTLPYHAHVQLNLSQGPGTKPSEHVPNTDGMTLKQALAAINGANLRLLYLPYPVTTKAQAGKVVQQTPLGGDSAPQNAQVLVFLAEYRR